MGDLCFRDGEKVLFIGDSITDCGRMGAAPPLGDGYVSLLADLVMGLYPERSITWVNKGTSGNWVTDLQSRWEEDVLREAPDWLVVKIGINDVHSQINGAPDAITPERFRAVYDELLACTQSRISAKIILITPFYISADHSETSTEGRVLKMLPAYLGVVEEMGKKYGLKVINLQDMFARQLRYRPSKTFCPEPIHPNRTGHLLIAQRVLAALSE